MKHWAWVRMKIMHGKVVSPPVYQLMMGTNWGEGNNVISEHANHNEAERLAQLYNKQARIDDEVER